MRKVNNCSIIRLCAAFGSFGITYELKSGRISGCSAQHCRMIFIASGGAAPFDTDGRISGGGFFIFDIISSADNDSMQYGSPRTTTSCIMMPNEYTSAGCVPYFECPLAFRNSSGAVHSCSEMGSVAMKIDDARRRQTTLHTFCCFRRCGYALRFIEMVQTVIGDFEHPSGVDHTISRCQ